MHPSDALAEEDSRPQTRKLNLQTERRERPVAAWPIAARFTLYRGASSKPQALAVGGVWGCYPKDKRVQSMGTGTESPGSPSEQLRLINWYLSSLTFSTLAGFQG